MNQKFDATTFKHITIEYVIMDAKPQNPNFATGQVSLNVEHQPGKGSAYNEGNNLRFVRFKINHADGTKTLDALSTSSFVGSTGLGIPSLIAKEMQQRN